MEFTTDDTLNIENTLNIAKPNPTYAQYTYPSKVTLAQLQASITFLMCLRQVSDSTGHIQVSTIHILKCLHFNTLSTGIITHIYKVPFPGTGTQV